MIRDITKENSWYIIFDFIFLICFSANILFVLLLYV